MKLEELQLKTPQREILIDITSEINKIIRDSNIKKGICRLFVPHTTAGITINENADPSVQKDIINFLNKLVPKGGGLGYNFSHREGNSDAHIKTSLIGNSINLIVQNGSLQLGTWQGCYFTEFDGPRNRKVFIQIEGE